MTNNPRKIAALNTLGVPVMERMALRVPGNPHNQHNLATKAAKLGHRLSGPQAPFRSTPGARFA